MKAKNLRSVLVKHFGFLEESHGFTYDDSSSKHGSCSYVKKDLRIEVQHMNAELKVLFISKQETKSLLKVMTSLLKRDFSYPEHFSSLVLSMGDVESRLAYDAKLMKKYGKEIL